jgi:acid phosphatase family membrane protein YuiD
MVDSDMALLREVRHSLHSRRLSHVVLFVFVTTFLLTVFFLLVRREGVSTSNEYVAAVFGLIVTAISGATPIRDASEIHAKLLAIRAVENRLKQAQTSAGSQASTQLREDAGDLARAMLVEILGSS